LRPRASLFERIEPVKTRVNRTIHLYPSLLTDFIQLNDHLISNQVRCVAFIATFDRFNRCWSIRSIKFG
jgi:hypothetical protein